MKGKGALELVYPHLVRAHGKAYADRWLGLQQDRGSQILSRAPLYVEATFEPLRSPVSVDNQPERVRVARQPVNPAPATAEAMTKVLTACLVDDLTPSQLVTFRFLHTAALSIAARRGYTPSVTRVTFFCPAEVMAFALGIHRATLWRHLQPMRELGLLDARPHMTTHRGQTVTDGFLWCLRLHPKRGKAPRLSYDELKYQYRDLSADIAAGRTAYALTHSDVQQSKELTEDVFRLEHILAWALTPQANSTPVKSDCCTSRLVALETVLNVPHVSKAERRAVVGNAAQAIVNTLGDHGSHRFYCRLLWNLLRRHNQGQSYFTQFYQMILRARADYAEGFARSAGALLVTRLKQWEVWNWLEQTPMTRVV